MKLFFFLLAFFCLSLNAQDLTVVQLTSEDKVEDVKSHYRWENSDGHFAIIDLWLLNSGRYVYKITSNVYNAYSEGFWKKSKNFITIKSEIQKDNLPIKVSFRPKTLNDFDVKRIAFLKDLNDSIVSNAFIYVNNDSISCLYGDMMCQGYFTTITRVRVQYENLGISSQWVDLQPFEGLLQITILSRKNLSNFIVFPSKKYRIIDDKLKPYDE